MINKEWEVTAQCERTGETVYSKVHTDKVMAIMDYNKQSKSKIFGFTIELKEIK